MENNITNEVKVCDVSIPIVSGPIGINLSGGADSSILLYILMKNVTDKIHIFTMASSQKARISAIISTNVIEELIQLTGKTNIEHHITYVEMQTTQNVALLVKEYYKEGKIRAYYTGVTANPPKNILEQFGIECTTFEARDPNIERKTMYDNYILTPFTNIDKKKIYEMYAHYDLLNVLFPKTRSCEVENRLNFTGHCNACWWCKEREWAFGNV